jgi:hypothetical protein
MGGMMGAFKPSYDPNQEVPGTGSTVKELEDSGVTDDQLKAGGVKKKPGWLTSGLATGLATGLQNYGNEQNAIARRPQMSPSFYGQY